MFIERVLRRCCTGEMSMFAEEMRLEGYARVAGICRGVKSSCQGKFVVEEKSCSCWEALALGREVEKELGRKDVLQNMNALFKRRCSLLRCADRR